MFVPGRPGCGQPTLVIGNDVFVRCRQRPRLGRWQPFRCGGKLRYRYAKIPRAQLRAVKLGCIVGDRFVTARPHIGQDRANRIGNFLRYYGLTAKRRKVIPECLRSMMKNAHGPVARCKLAPTNREKFLADVRAIDQ
jgi:hypothetical protein